MPTDGQATSATLGSAKGENGQDLTRAAMLFAAGLVLCVLAYLAANVPAKWFPSATQKAWSARELTLTRGVGRVEDDSLIVAAPDSSGLVLVSLVTDFRSNDYPSIAWVAIDVPRKSDVRLLWSNDYAPNKLHSAPLTIASGRLMPIVLVKDPNWVGRITGLALAVRGPLPQPLMIRGVAAKPTGAIEIMRDRVHEWSAFEGWSGSSINTITGGADAQDLPLQVLLAVAIAIAVGAWYALARRGAGVARLPMAIALLFVVAWFVLDARWGWNLARQVRETAAQYAGKDWKERHLAADDKALFDFIQQVRAKLPETPARVFMVADRPYFRGRGAYHLYPHNVYHDPRVNAIPPPSALRPGDYLVVYQRRGIQYDPAQQRLRWDGGEPVSAELLLAVPGAAAFRIR
jgi:hypothetical protein